MKDLIPSIEGSELISENIFNDERGSFQRIFDNRKITNKFFEGVKNINLSKNEKEGTFRGLHMQTGSASETKIINCIKGEIIDLFVDCRIKSATFGQINLVYLSQEISNSLLIPRGCLHSFITLTNKTEVIYLTDNYYDPNKEVAISPFSEEIQERLHPHQIKVCSDKDRNSKKLSTFFDELKINS